MLIFTQDAICAVLLGYFCQNGVVSCVFLNKLTEIQNWNTA